MNQLEVPYLLLRDQGQLEKVLERVEFLLREAEEDLRCTERLAVKMHWPDSDIHILDSRLIIDVMNLYKAYIQNCHRVFSSRRTK